MVVARFLEATPAQSPEGSRRMTASEIRLAIPPDPLAKLPALAERLGVKPRRPEDPSTVVLHASDGQQFDLFELIGAALDKIDGAFHLIEEQKR
jgi:hypothetical protein